MSAYPAYNYGSTARKLQHEAVSPFEVVQGGAHDRQANTASSAVVLFAKALIVGIIVFAIIGAVRITLSSATVALALEAKQLDTQIEIARDEGSSLEVAQSSLSNPSRIKSEAAAIGMAAPSSTKFMDLSGDIVVTDKAGALSLTGSIDALLEADLEAEATNAVDRS